MTTQTEKQIEAQLPEGAVKDGSGEAAGVLRAGFEGNNDVLEYQAGRIAQKRGIQAGAAIYQDGAAMPEDILKRVSDSAFPGAMGMNQQTINALQQGGLQRQDYVGNNAQWTGYYLEPAAKFIVPLDTPLNNMMPRVSGPGIDKANWRSIVDVFGGQGPTVGQFILQQRGTPNKLNYEWVDMQNLFRTLAVGDDVTFESEIYGQLFEPDMRAKVAAKLIPALMLGREVCYINGSQNLWNPASPLLAAAATGGTLAAGVYWFIVTATNANGETLGSQIVSVPVTGSGTGSVTLTLNRVPNATAYNVYAAVAATQPANSALFLQDPTADFGNVNALNDAGGYDVGQITATMTALKTSGTAYSTRVTGGNTAISFVSTDTKTAGQPLMFDGIQSLIYKFAGTPTTNATGGLTSLVTRPASPVGTLVKTDMDGHLRRLYMNARANPDVVFCGVLDHITLTNIVANDTNFRVTQVNGQGQANLTGGYRAVQYINPVTGKLIDIVMLPYLMQGTIIFASFNIPFPVAEITKAPFRIEYNRDMWAMEYPPDQSHQTTWAYSAFVNESMICQYLGGFGIITGIAAPAGV